MSEVIARLLGKLPKGDGNGLGGLAAELAKDPGRIRVGIVMFDADRIVEKTDDGDHEVRIRHRRIEVAKRPEHLTTLERILLEIFEERTGGAQLPMELHDDADQAFREARIAQETPTSHEGATEEWSPAAELAEAGDADSDRDGD